MAHAGSNGAFFGTFFGASEFAVPILEKLAASRYRPWMVVTTPDAPAGRGQQLKPPPVKVAAERMGIPAIQPRILAPDNLHLAPDGADLFIVAAYGKILPPELLAIPKQGSLNVHPSLLPRWRGASPVQHAILAGDTETGVTIILMDAQVDHGPVLQSSKFKVQSSKLTTPELTAQLADVGAQLLLETIPAWLDSKITPRPQDEGEATYAPRIRKEDGRIDWNQPAVEVERMTRAFQPWPGAYTFWHRSENQLRLAIEEARVENLESRIENLEVGTVFSGNGGIGVRCGEGALILQRLKAEGGRAMDGMAFLRGHPDIIGATLR